jgi:predicted HicB family RNase H-like nuclease
METTTQESKKDLTGSIQLRITPKQKTHLMLMSARKRLTVSSFLRNLINQSIINQKNIDNE